MTLFALGTIVCFLLFMTIGWPSGPARLLKAGMFFCALAFLASASVAIFAAARETYSRRPHD